MNKYDELKKINQDEFNKFPIYFAFSEEQIKEVMEKLGLNENEKDKLISTGSGGFIRKTDKEAFLDMIEKLDKRIKYAIKGDITGDGFIKDMFESELANHEYGYTRDLDDTLDSLELTIEEINSNSNLKHGLSLALEKYGEKGIEEDLIEYE